mgnify:CR=1 FL=1
MGKSIPNLIRNGRVRTLNMWKLSYQGILTGPPKPMGRPRMTRRGTTYTPKTSREYKEEAVESIASTLADGWTPLDGPLRIQITFVHSRPQRLQRSSVSTGRIWKVTKPDTDNLLKMVLDTLTVARVWEDDNRVCSISCSDYYGAMNEEPHTLFTVYEWGDDA